MLGLPSLGGCGGPTSSTVSGSIRVGGAPLRSGIVCIHATDHRTFSTSVNEGEFEVRGVPPGAIQLTVTSQPILTDFRYETPAFAEGAKPRGESETSRFTEPQFATQALAAKYGHVDTSPLRYEVAAGLQHLALSLDE